MYRNMDTQVKFDNSSVHRKSQSHNSYGRKQIYDIVPNTVILESRPELFRYLQVLTTT